MHRWIIFPPSSNRLMSFTMTTSTYISFTANLCQNFVTNHGCHFSKIAYGQLVWCILYDLSFQSITHQTGAHLVQWPFYVELACSLHVCEWIFCQYPHSPKACRRWIRPCGPHAGLLGLGWYKEIPQIHMGPVFGQLSCAQTLAEDDDHCCCQL